jgi:hypothetical protein
LQTIVLVAAVLLLIASVGYLLVIFATSPVDKGPASALWFFVFSLMTAVTLRLGLPTRSLVLFAVAWLILISAMTGLIYRGEPASQFDLDSVATSVPDGWYARIGERDGLLFLLPCPQGSAAVVAVRPDAVRSVRTAAATPDRRPAPSLWDLVAAQGVEALGLDPACP